MKSTKRTIAICGLAAVMSASLLAGITYAWFTDSITNSGNTISSGDLKIDAYAYDLGEGGKTYTINDTEYTFESDDDRQNLKEENTAVITETNWYPGQSSAKMFTVENVGSLDAEVSLTFFVSGDLTDALWYDFIRVDGDSVVGNFTRRDMSSLSSLAENTGGFNVASGESISFVFVYGMYEDASNDYMSKSVQVNVVISAKQTTDGAVGPKVVNPGTDLASVFNDIASNSTVVLTEGEYDVSGAIDVTGKNGIVIEGNGATIIWDNGTSENSISLFSVTNSGDESVFNIVNSKNITIRNLTVQGAEKHGINLYESTGVVIENVSAINNNALGICVNGSEVTLKNVTTYGNVWGGVNLDSKAESVVFTADEKCVFEEDLQVYADTAEMAKGMSVTLPSNYTGIEVTFPSGEGTVSRYLWTTASVVTDSATLMSAVSKGGKIIFGSDIQATIYRSDLADNVSINLNNYTLTTTGVILNEGKSLTIENGKLNMLASSNPFALKSEANLVMRYLDVESSSTIVLVGDSNFTGDNATVLVEYCNFETSDSTAITTNASKSPWYCEIVVRNSVITCDSPADSNYPYDNCPIYMNVPGYLEIDGCTITGQRQGVMVRAGTAYISNSTIICTAEYDKYDMYLSGDWGTGNEVPMAALVVGNRGAANNSYEYETYVELVNCTITSANNAVPAIYIWGNTSEETKVTFKFDTDTYNNLTGYIDGVLVSTENSKVEIISPIITADITTADELKAALEKGGIVIVSTEITLDEQVIISGDTKTQLVLAEGSEILFTADGIIDLKNAQLVISGNGAITQDMQSKEGYLVRAEGSSAVIIESGSFLAGLTCVQAGDSATVEIYGGSFKVLVNWNDVYWHLNLIDNSSATIIVYGGTFLEFDPSNSKTENPVADFVAEGYTVETTQNDEGTWYTVVAASVEE